MIEKNLLNFKETASFLNIKESHLRGLIFKRKIPFLKIGRLLRFDPKKLLNWLEKQNKEVES